MPNYSKRERELLSEDEQALSSASRQPGLGTLTDAALLQLISDLAQALAVAGSPGQDGEKTRADLMKAALNRAHSERRKRGLQVSGAKSATKRDKKPASKPATVAAAPTDPDGAGPAGIAPAVAAHPVAAQAVPAAPRPKPTKRVPATTARKPAGRKPAKDRKTDLRTGSRLVVKAKARPATGSDIALPAPEAPMQVASTPPLPAVTAPASRAANSADMDKVQRQADRKAAKDAEKEIRKAARKAEKKAAKEAEKAARKAARKIAREAEKATLKAIRKASDDKKPGKGGKDRKKKKKDSEG